MSLQTFQKIFFLIAAGNPKTILRYCFNALELSVEEAEEVLYGASI